MPLTTGASASYQLFLHFILAYFCIVPIFFWALMISRFGPIKQLPSNTIDYAINTSGCRFPLPNHILWPPRNRKMRSRHNTCRGKELFVHFNNTNIPVLNAQLLLAAHGVTPEALTCYYSSLRMATTPPNAATNVAMLDSDVEFSAKRLLSFGTKLYEDGVRITCMKDGDNLFTEYHMVPQKKRLHMQRRSSIDDTLKMGGTHDKKLSVLVVGIESVSRLDAMRHLRKSRQYLLRQLNAYELLAYNGVGDGFRNKLALMTGFDKREVSRSQRNGFTDLSTHLVRAFGGRGYIRLFAEDVAFADPFSSWETLRILRRARRVLPKASH
ncbi:hypothetical protein HPB48_010579 [Haemaphysalis longicornis]|uniref:Uncharacterized protein n=1 Tax=Haemaphysalis longicornis TaxID=44386 RepID=A0A9J6H416_HAELO|nr:hypothetical protein HPB48_010579 [Haemaphysalis longicornis]